MAGWTLEMPVTLVPRPERGVHRVALVAGRRDQEPARVPERPRALKHHLHPAGRIVADLIAEEPPDRLGLQPRLRPRPPAVKRHPLELESRQSRFRHPTLDRPAGLERGREPIPDEVPQLVLGGRHPHGGAGIFGDGPAGAVHHRLGLGALGRALNGDVPDAVVGEVLHHRPHPGRRVRTPATGERRCLVHVDMFFAPLPRGTAIREPT